MKRKILLLSALCCVVFATKNTFSLQYVKGLYNFFTDSPGKLHKAIMRKDEQEVERLLEEGVGPNSCYNSKDRMFESYMNMTPGLYFSKK